MDDVDFDAIVHTFALESEEHAGAMEDALLALERGSGDVESLRCVFRGAHTLKGNAATLGFEALAEFAHTLEDLLDAIGGDVGLLRADRVELLLRSVDTMRALVREAARGVDALDEGQRALVGSLVAAAAEVRADGATRVAAGAPRAATTPAEGESRRARSLRVEVDKLDRLLDLVGEISVSRARVARLLDDPAAGAGEAAEAHGAADRLQLDLQELVMQMRMVRIGPVFRQFVRLVRDVAGEQGKQVRLDIEGEDVEVDTAILEQVKDPLTHMIRNALDHAMEAPAARIEAGKPAEGRILLRARHHAGALLIEVGDDGAGLDRVRIAGRARAMGIADPEALPDRDLLGLIFEPGFSTAESVSDLSGRGVGMDVVRRNIEALRGTVELDSVAGAGTTITLRLPLTLAILSGFSVGVGDETYLLPLAAVTECLQLPESERAGEGATGVLSLRGRPLPWLRVRQWFGEASARPARESVVVVSDGLGAVGLVVDRLLGESQAVIKPVGRMLRGVPNVAGTTMLGDGRVALLLDVAAILREARATHALALTSTVP